MWRKLPVCAQIDALCRAVNLKEDGIYLLRELLRVCPLGKLVARSNPHNLLALW